MNSYITKEDLLNVLPLVLKSVYKYPGQVEHNESVLGYADKLPSTPGTITSLLTLLQADKDAFGDLYYEQILSEASPKHLAPHLDELKELIPSDYFEVIQYRMNFFETTTELLWHELITTTDDSTIKDGYDFNLSYVEHLVVELSTRNDLPPEMILEQFDQTNHGSEQAILLAGLLGRLK